MACNRVSLLILNFLVERVERRKDFSKKEGNFFSPPHVFAMSVSSFFSQVKLRRLQTLTRTRANLELFSFLTMIRLASLIGATSEGKMSSFLDDMSGNSSVDCTANTACTGDNLTVHAFLCQLDKELPSFGCVNKMRPSRGNLVSSIGQPNASNAI